MQFEGDILRSIDAGVAAQPLVPSGLVMAVIQATTNGETEKFYQARPDRWRHLSQSDKFWTELFNLISDKRPEPNDVMNTFSADYGIMLVPYTDALDIFLHDLKEGRTLQNTIFRFEQYKNMSEEQLKLAPSPNVLRNDSGLNIMYGTKILYEVMKQTFAVLQKFTDKGLKTPTLEQFMKGDAKITFLGKTLPPIDFFKLVVTAYLSDVETVSKALGIMRGEAAMPIWANVAPYLHRVCRKNPEIIIQKVSGAFEGVKDEELKVRR